MHAAPLGVTCILCLITLLLHMLVSAHGITTPSCCHNCRASAARHHISAPSPHRSATRPLIHLPTHPPIPCAHRSWARWSTRPTLTRTSPTASPAVMAAPSCAATAARQHTTQTVSACQTYRMTGWDHDLIESFWQHAVTIPHTAKPHRLFVWLCSANMKTTAGLDGCVLYYVLLAHVCMQTADMHRTQCVIPMLTLTH